MTKRTYEHAFERAANPAARRESHAYCAEQQNPPQRRTAPDAGRRQRRGYSFSLLLVA